MRTIHAVLAIPQRLYRDMLCSMLSREYDVQVVAHAHSELAVAASLRNLLDDGDFAVDDPVVLVTSLEDTAEIPATCARLLGEFPEVTIVGICWATACIRSFQLRIDVQEIHCSMKGLVDAIRDCASRPLPW